jgi:hypothetical protein
MLQNTPVLVKKAPECFACSADNKQLDFALLVAGFAL